MKKIIITALCFVCCITVFAQDVLLFQDGSKKDAEVLEITPELVKYKNYKSNDVIYTENKYNLIGIVFENGEFEKFETKKSSYSNIVKNSIVSDYGHNMFSLNPFSIINNLIVMHYEHFSNNGKSAIRIPLWIDITSGTDLNKTSVLNLNSNYRTKLKTGFEHRFFPTGHSGVARGFIGYAEHLGIMSHEQLYYSYNNYGDPYYGSRIDSEFFEDTQFIGGVQFHPSKLIALTLDAGIGPGYLFKSDEFFLSYNLGFSLGFRF